MRRIVTNGILLAAITLSLIPVAYLLFGSLWSSFPGLPGYLTPQHYLEVFGDPFTTVLLLNTIGYAIGAASMSSAIALFLSLVVNRTDAPFRTIVGFSMIILLAIPWLVEDLSWTYLLSPQTGILNLWFRWLSHSDLTLFNIYSIWGMIWVMGLGLTPLAYLIISASVNLIDRSLEESSRIAGASLWSTFLRIDAPLVLPAILSAFLLCFIISMGAFDVAAIIGVPGRVSVLTNSIFSAIFGEVPPNYGLGSAYAMTLVAITSFGTYLYLRATRRSDRYVTVTGRTTPPRLFRLGRWRPLAGATLLAYFIGYPLMIILTLIFVSLHSFWNPTQLTGLTFENYLSFLSFPTLAAGLFNSLTVSASASVLTLLFGFFIAYASFRSGGIVGRIAQAVTTIPLAFPTIVLGVGLLWALVYLPVGVYGTIWALTLAYTIRYVPVSTRFLNGPLLQVHRELEEISRISGATFGYTLRRIMLPLLKSPITVAMIYVFLVSIKDLGAAVMLVTGKSVVISYAIFTIWQSGHFLIAAAAGVMLVAVLLVTLTLTSMILKLSPIALVAPVRRSEEVPSR